MRLDDRKIASEIHLPQLVGLRAFEPLMHSRRASGVRSGLAGIQLRAGRIVVVPQSGDADLAPRNRWRPMALRALPAHLPRASGASTYAASPPAASALAGRGARSSAG